MEARVTIIDDNGNPKATYELKPSRIYEGGISTKYVFEFEYNKLNYDKYKAESEKKIGMTFNNLCNSCTNVEAIPKDQYEARLKADKITMLTEIQTEIEEIETPLCHSATYAKGCVDRERIEGLIQQKINALKENKKGNQRRM